MVIVFGPDQLWESLGFVSQNKKSAAIMIVRQEAENLAGVRGTGAVVKSEGGYFSRRGYAAYHGLRRKSEDPPGDHPEYRNPPPSVLRQEPTPLAIACAVKTL